MRDREAVDRLKSGDIGGLEELAHAYYVRAVRAAYLITHDRALAEDATQDAFIYAYQRIGRFDSSRPVGPWLLRIVVNNAIDAANRRGRDGILRQPRGSGEEGIPPTELLHDPGALPDELLERAETRDEVWAAVGQLPPKQRAVVVMRYYLDLSEGEIAEELDCPPGTVKWRLHAARARLQALLRL